MANIDNSDYYTLLTEGTREDFEAKLASENKSLADVVQERMPDGSSVLRYAIASRKIDLAREMLAAGAPVNVIDYAGNNEFHLLSYRLTQEPGAAELGMDLLERGTSLKQPENRWNNPAIFSLISHGVASQDPAVRDFLVRALQSAGDVDTPNRSGVTVRSIIDRRGDDWIQQALREYHPGGAPAETEQPRRVARFGASIVSQSILDGHGRVKWCFREEPDNKMDNGWRFLSARDTNEYLADPRNSTPIAWDSVILIEPAVMPLLDKPVGTDVQIVDSPDGEILLVDNATGQNMEFGPDDFRAYES